LWLYGEDRCYLWLPEDFMPGCWVRVLASAEQVRKERPGMMRVAGGVPGRSLGLSRSVAWSPKRGRPATLATYHSSK
jgi:hypothetical protein